MVYFVLVIYLSLKNSLQTDQKIAIRDPSARTRLQAKYPLFLPYFGWGMIWCISPNENIYHLKKKGRIDRWNPCPSTRVQANIFVFDLISWCGRGVLEFKLSPYIELPW